MRAARSRWSDAELALLKHLMWLAEPGQVNHQGVAYLFPGRSWLDIKKRCSCIRDLARRKERKRQREDVHQQDVAAEEEEAEAEPGSPTSVMPPEGRLHPALVWVPPTTYEIGPMNLGT
jgi:hypothetical protein